MEKNEDASVIKRGRGRPRKESKLPPKDKEEASDDKAKNYKSTAAVMKNCSLQTTGKTTDTIVGPINEWACIPENLPNHPTLAFFGKRRTGKSTTITNIAYHCCQDIPFGMVMSDTAYAGNSFNL
jgi:hypothetical protein